MNKPAPAKALSDLIATARSQLTPTDRLIAEAVLVDKTLLAFGTVTDLATRVGTSRPSIVRFATRLGFDGYVHLQEHIRERLALEMGRPSERIRHADGTIGPTRVALDQAMNSVFAWATSCKSRTPV